MFSGEIEWNITLIIHYKTLVCCILISEFMSMRCFYIIEQLINIFFFCTELIFLRHFILKSAFYSYFKNTKKVHKAWDQGVTCLTLETKAYILQICKILNPPPPLWHYPALGGQDLNKLESKLHRYVSM